MLAAAMFVGASCTSSSPEPIRIGAVYPLSGTQGPAGVHELDRELHALELVDAPRGPGASTSSRACSSRSSS